MKPTDSFVDEAVIEAVAGRGGDGCASFRRERYVPRGGPDGGDGGRGGDVVLLADPGLATLLDLERLPLVRAGDGARGGGNGRDGRAGADRVVRVPVGTLVYEADAGDAGAQARPLADLAAPGERLVAARGGRGGRGNRRFATPTRQAPDTAEAGRPGEARRLRLSLKLLADVGLVGLPNAGKSTLLRRLSAARPRVGAYPFTTLVPALGVAEALGLRFVVADLPGLVEGASLGTGLGDRFLRHVERTRVLVHVLDVGTARLEGRDPLADYETIRRELGAYAEALAERTEIVALAKIDLVPERSVLAPLVQAFGARGREVVLVSGATGEGVERLAAAMARALAAARAAEAAAADPDAAPREAAP